MDAVISFGPAGAFRVMERVEVPWAEVVRPPVAPRGYVPPPTSWLVGRAIVPACPCGRRKEWSGAGIVVIGDGREGWTGAHLACVEAIQGGRL